MSTLLQTKTAGNDDDLSQDDSYVNDVDCRGNYFPPYLSKEMIAFFLNLISHF